MVERDPMQQMILDELKTLREEQRKGFSDNRSEFNARIDKLVTQEAFTAEQRRVDDRLADLGSDIVSEREARLVNERTAKEKNDKVSANLRWLAAAIVLPVALFLANLVVIRG